jgi:hypothetical protein
MSSIASFAAFIDAPGRSMPAINFRSFSRCSCNFSG